MAFRGFCIWTLHISADTDMLADISCIPRNNNVQYMQDIDLIVNNWSMHIVYLDKLFKYLFMELLCIYLFAGNALVVDSANNKHLYLPHTVL